MKMIVGETMGNFSACLGAAFFTRKVITFGILSSLLCFGKSSSRNGLK